MSQNVRRTETDFTSGALMVLLTGWHGQETEQLLVDLRCGRCGSRVGLVTRSTSDDPRDQSPLLVLHAQDVRDDGGPADVFTSRHLLMDSDGAPDLWCRTHEYQRFDPDRVYRKAQDAIAGEVDGAVVPKKLRGTPVS